MTQHIKTAHIPALTVELPGYVTRTHAKLPGHVLGKEVIDGSSDASLMMRKMQVRKKSAKRANSHVARMKMFRDVHGSDSSHGVKTTKRGTPQENMNSCMHGILKQSPSKRK